MNRWEFLKDNIPRYQSNPFIDEIVITDENGNDADKIFNTFDDQSKLKVIINPQRLGCFRNKIKSILSASNDCVAIIDSDNFADVNYFEAFFKYIERNHYNNMHIYSPDDSIPDFSFKTFSNWKINRDNVLNFFEHHHSSNVLINQGNYILSKSLVQKIDFSLYDNEIKSFNSADVMLLNYMFFKHIPNFTLNVVPNMSYNHVVHSDSIVLQNPKHQESVIELFRMYYKLHNKIPPFDIKKKKNNNFPMNKTLFSFTAAATGLLILLLTLRKN